MFNQMTEKLMTNLKAALGFNPGPFNSFLHHSEIKHPLPHLMFAY
jgi:hypothetical protein